MNTFNGCAQENKLKMRLQSKGILKKPPALNLMGVARLRTAYAPLGLLRFLSAFFIFQSLLFDLFVHICFYNETKKKGGYGGLVAAVKSAVPQGALG